MSFYYTYLTYVNSSLTVPEDGAKYYADKKDGKYGFNTDPNRGADTFIPFSSFEELTFKYNTNLSYTFPIDVTELYIIFNIDDWSNLTVKINNVITTDFETIDRAGQGSWGMYVSKYTGQSIKKGDVITTIPTNQYYGVELLYY